MMRKILLTGLAILCSSGAAHASCESGRTGPYLPNLTIPWAFNSTIYSSGPGYGTLSMDGSCDLNVNIVSGGSGGVTVTQGNTGTSAQAWFEQAAAGSFLDGWNQTEGTKADTAYTGTGSASEIAIEKGIYAALAGAATATLQTTGNSSLSTIAANTAVTVAGTSATSGAPIQGMTGGVPVPTSLATLPALVAGSAVAGKFGIDQTTPGTTNNVTVTPQAVTVTWAGGSVTTGGAFQSALATSSSRKGCQIQNTSSGIEYVNSSGSPTVLNANQINPYGTYTCSVTTNLVDQAAIEISGATTGQTYVVASW